MLSRDYVENKLRAAAEGRQGSDIQPLINRCDQLNLATALANDCNLACKLFLQQLFNTSQFDANTYKRILQGIDEIEGKYFAKFSDSLTSLPPQTSAPSNTRHHLGDPPSRSGIGQSIYNTIASSFRGTKSSIRSRPSLLSSNNDCDKTFYINSKKAD